MVPDINLLPKYEKRQSDSKLRYMLLGIIIFLLLSYFIWQYFSARGQITNLQPKESTLVTERNQLQARKEALLSENQWSIGQSIEFIELISYPVSPIMDETQALQPPNSYLREYNFERTKVTITLDFETLTDVSHYISRLSNSPYFVDGHVVSITNLEIGNGIDKEINFDEVPRQTVEIELLINQDYLATEGVQQ